MKLNFLTSIKPEQVFVSLASIFGVIFLLMTPPFQSPDENRHFYRAYHISQGSISATKINGRVGGFLPKKIKESVVPFSEMRGQIEHITSRKELISIIQGDADNTKEFVDFPSMAVYTPVSYVPQAVGMRIAHFFSDSALISLYAGRLMALLCWILAVYFAIRISPIFKWLFVALALLPMSLYIHASVSADIVTNAVVFLLIATFLKQAFSDEKQRKKDFLILALLVFLLASAKFIYSPLLLLYFLIPLSKFENKKQFFFRFLLLGVVALCTTACWPLIQGVGYVPYADYNPDYRGKVNLLECSNIHEQISYISSHGFYLFKVLGNSLVQSFDTYYTGFIGNFGWGEVPLSSFWLAFGYLGLLGIALMDGRSDIKISGFGRIVSFSSFSIIFSLVIISQLLIWTCIGNDVVGNLQGRYFTPIGPLLFFIFYRSSDRFRKYLPAGVIVFSSTLLIVSTLLIYKRFYLPLEYSTEIVMCDHEQGKGTSDFGTSDPNVFGRNGFSRSNEKARSGKYSSKLSADIKFGTIISFEDCNGGDAIEVEAWRNGPHGVMVVATEGGKKLYRAEGKVEETSEEWQRMKFWIRVPATIENEKISCCLSYFEETDSCYFDDIKITLKRIK